MLKKKKKYLKKLYLDLFGKVIKSKVINTLYFKQIYLNYFFISIKKPIHLLLMVERPVIKRIKNEKRMYKNKYFYIKNILSFFYRNIKLNKLMKIIKKNVNKSIDNIFSKLEMRLDMILYRFFLSTISLGEIKQKILNKKFLVNFKVVKNIHYEVKLGDIISLEKNFSKLMYKKLKRKFLSKKFYNKFFRNPKYLYVNYQNMLCLVYKKPILKELPFFFNLRFSNVRYLGYKY